MFLDWLISTAKSEYVAESAANTSVSVKVNSSFSSLVFRLSSISSSAEPISFVSSLAIVLSISLAHTLDMLNRKRQAPI